VPKISCDFLMTNMVMKRVLLRVHDYIEMNSL
jgi:hypothetical protein